MATPLVENSDSANGGSSAVSTLTISNFAISSAYGNRLLDVGVGYRGGDYLVSGITFDGDALTKLDRVENNVAETAVEKWYLKNPDAKTGDIVVTFSGNVYCMVGALSIYNVAQTTTFGTQAKNASVSTSSTIDVSSATDELVVDICAKKGTGDGGVITAGAGQTDFVNDQSTSGTDLNNVLCGMSTKLGSATTTMSWSWDGLGNRYKAQIAVPIKYEFYGVTGKTIQTIIMG